MFAVSLWLHLTVAVALAIVPAFALQLPIFERLQFLSSVVGWRGVADAVRAKLGEDHYAALLVDSREMAAELLYYMRDSVVPLYVCAARDPIPTDQYEMTRAYGAGAPEPVLFVSLKRCPSKPQASPSPRSSSWAPGPSSWLRAKTRVLHFCRLAGYKGELR